MTTERCQIVDIDYTNWKGERRTRRVRPIAIEFRVSPWHGTAPMWFMLAVDEENGQVKDFAMSGLAGWVVHGVDGPRTYQEVCAEYEAKGPAKQGVLFPKQQGRSAQEEKR